MIENLQMVNVHALLVSALRGGNILLYYISFYKSGPCDTKEGFSKNMQKKYIFFFTLSHNAFFLMF